MSRPLALTMGEPAGIGTEITLKAYAALSQAPPGRAPTFFLIDDPVRVEKAVRVMDADVRVATIEAPQDAVVKSIMIAEGESVEEGQILMVLEEAD